MKTILQPGRNCWSVHSAPDSGVLVDGQDYFRALYKALQEAKHSILLAGWHFDSSVPLLYGPDSRRSNGETELLPLLNRLTAENPELHVYILAWDFNLIYTMKREFRQARLFNSPENPRIQFRFDASHPFGGCHHQKFAVIDGGLAFVGGMDLCREYWDDRRHSFRHRYRLRPGNKSCGPRHDVQSYSTGPVAEHLAHLFAHRWQMAGGAPLRLPPPRKIEPTFQPTYSLGPQSVAISRTMGRTIFPRQRAISEIRRLYQDAILAAEQSIYIENQYFSSYSIYRALANRMRAPGRPPLRIVIMMARQPEAFIEEIGLGTMQAKYLRAVLRVAARTRHTIGLYNTRAAGRGHHETTYIHSKLLIVDDRFLSIGSANISNRSMGFDSELNLSWEATGPEQSDLIKSIRDIRVGLLAEHTGLHKVEDLERLANPEGLVSFLNSLADNRHDRLQHHQIGHKLLSEWITTWTPHDWLIDPRKSVLAEKLHRWIRKHRHSAVTKMLDLFRRWKYPRLLRRKIPHRKMTAPVP